MYIPNQLENLPKPVSMYRVGPATLEVYRAKSAGTSSWENPTLLELVKGARESFYQYTEDPPLFDEYDDKSAVYMTKATYPISTDGDQSLVEEWVSVRFVPGKGSPQGFQDLRMYEYNGKRIDHLVAERLLPEKGTRFWEHLVSISKLCGIRPHLQDVEKNGRINLTRKLSYTGVSLAFMSHQFFKDAGTWDLESEYVTLQIPKDLVKKSLMVALEGITSSARFILASETLSLENQKEIRLIRNTYTYRYPIYFFSFPNTLKMLQGLYQDGRISKATIKYYLGENVSLEKVASLPLYASMFCLRGFGKMLTEKGRLREGTITGEELRKMADELEDGPTLYIISSDVWKKDTERLCSKFTIKVD